MMYFTATVLTKGKKEQFGFYAKDKKEANSIAKLKFNGIILKVVEDKEPLEEQFKRFKTNLLKNFKKKKIKQDGLISAIRQLAVMTNAGISIHDSLSEIADATDDEALKTVFS
ncbi:MAG TPA: type II secretion system F family protein, partial [Sulfurimonas sp.]|nr:type II secretion system F family protein [Sulfurimonas sp.]